MDAAQCYDRIAHAAAALTLRTYNARQLLVASMLAPIHSMEYYRRTGFGEPKTFLGGAEDPKQGAYQTTGRPPPHGSRSARC